jgi:hypothetical protein
MATVNLGSIKFKWKGTYSGATAYTVDDVVEYNGSSYICILASTGNLPTNATYFEQMSQKGTDADLLSIASTAQGDLYYNNGGAIARLGAGTSGQYLQTNGAGANPAWGTVNSGLVQTVVQSYRTGFTQSLSGTSFTALNNGSTDLQVQITPTSTSNKIIIWCQLGYFSPRNTSSGYGSIAVIERKIGAGSYDGSFDRSDQVGSSRPRGLFYMSQPGDASYNFGWSFSTYDDTYNSTSQLTYRISVMNHDTVTAQIGYPSTHADTNYGYSGSGIMRLIAQEIA